MQGASATEEVLKEFAGKPVKVFIVWEPVLPTDWGAPSTASLRRISDPRAMQFWDGKRLISHTLGEHDRRSIIWDHAAVYPAGTIWNERPPQPLYEGGPVVHVVEPFRNAIELALEGHLQAVPQADTEDISHGFGSCGFAGSAPASSNTENESSTHKTSKNVAGQSWK